MQTIYSFDYNDDRAGTVRVPYWLAKQAQAVVHYFPAKQDHLFWGSTQTFQVSDDGYVIPFPDVSPYHSDSHVDMIVSIVNNEVLEERIKQAQQRYGLEEHWGDPHVGYSTSGEVRVKPGSIAWLVTLEVLHGLSQFSHEVLDVKAFRATLWEEAHETADWLATSNEIGGDEWEAVFGDMSRDDATLEITNHILFGHRFSFDLDQHEVLRELYNLRRTEEQFKANLLSTPLY